MREQEVQEVNQAPPDSAGFALLESLGACLSRLDRSKRWTPYGNVQLENDSRGAHGRADDTKSEAERLHSGRESVVRTVCGIYPSNVLNANYDAK